MTMIIKKLPNLTENDKIRFFSKIIKKSIDECWPWFAGCFDDGYGSFRIGNEQYRSNRIAYYIAYNIDPLDQLVCHTCDYTKCCNSSHLFLGTPLSNNQDCIQKGRRNLNGELNVNNKLTEKQVKEIRYKSLFGFRQRELAKEYNISVGHVSKIINNQNWIHI